MTKVEKKELNKFVGRLRPLRPLFLVIFALWLFPITVLLKSGEFYAIDDVIRKQITGEVKLFEPAYSNPNKIYKLHTTLKRNPEVLVVGTSRSLQIRSEFFVNPSKFYNAGIGVSKLSRIKEFMEKIPNGSRPKVVILALDQFFFNDTYNSTVPYTYDQELGSNILPLRLIRDGWSDIYLDYLYYKKFTLSGVFINQTKKTGLVAIAYGDGFRPDGSYLNNRIVHNPQKFGDPTFKISHQWIVEGKSILAHGQTISNTRLEEVESLLKYCQQNQIYLVTFLPPYAHQVYQELSRLKDVDYGYFFSVFPSIKPIFEKYGFPLYDFSDLATLNLSDNSMLDGTHPSERVAGMIVEEMAKDDRILKQYVDPDYIDGLIKASKNPLVLLPG